MSFCTIEVDELQLYNEIDKNSIGANLNTFPLRELSFVPNDSDTYFVDCTNGNDTYSGESRSPLKTIDKALELSRISGFSKIHVLSDANPYTINSLSSIKNPMTIQANLQVKPHLYINRFKSEFNGTSGLSVSLRKGILESFDDYVFLTENNEYITKWNTISKTQDLIGSTFIMKQLKKVRFLYTNNSSSETDLFCHNALESSNIRLYNWNTTSNSWSHNYWDYDVIANNIEGGIKDYTILFRTLDPATNYSYLYWLIVRESQKVLSFVVTSTYVHETHGITTTFNHSENINCCHTFRNKAWIGCGDGLYYKPVLSITSGTYDLSSSFIKVPIAATNIVFIYPYYFNNSVGSSTDDDKDRLYIGCKDGSIYEYNPTLNRWTYLFKTGYEITSLVRKKVGLLCDVMFIGSLEQNFIFRYDFDKHQLNKMFIEINDTYITDLTYLENTNKNYERFLGCSKYISSDETVNCLKIDETLKMTIPVNFNGFEFKPFNNIPYSGFELLYDAQDYILSFEWCTFENLSGGIYSNNVKLKDIKIKRCVFKFLSYGIYLLNAFRYDYKSNRPSIYNLDILDCVFEHIIYGSLAGHINGNVRNCVFYDNDFGIFHSGDMSLKVLGCIFLEIINTAVESLNQNYVSVLKSCFYYCSSNIINCLINSTLDIINQSPLFKSLSNNNENFHLQLIKLGSAFDSPCGIGGYYIAWESSSFDQIFESNEINIESNILGGIFIIVNNPNLQQVTINIYEYDGSNWNIIDSFQSADELINKYFFPAINYPNIKFTIEGESQSWYNTESFYWYRDIGCMNTVRNVDSDYENRFSMNLSYSPKSLIYNTMKNDENLVTNLYGNKCLVARPIQSTHLTFDWDNDNKQNEEELYQLTILSALNKYRFKLYFSDIINSSYSKGSSSGIIPTIIKSSPSARVYLGSQSFNILSSLPVISDNSKKWSVNEWKGFWVKITANNITYYKKILFNEVSKLWIEDTSNELASISTCNYEIQYFRCILGSTNIELLKDYFATYKTDEKYFGYINRKLEFWEA